MDGIHPSGFAGFVMSTQIDGGRAGASLTVEGGGVRARLRDGREFALPFGDVDFERGGASGRMVFLRSRSSDVIVGSEAQGFEQALSGSVDTVTRARLDAAVRKQSAQRGEFRLASLKWVAIVAAACVAIFYLLTYGLRATARNVPRSVDVAIGDAFESSLDSQYPAKDVPTVGAAFTAIFERFQPHIDHAGFEFEFRYVDSPLVNAMALPGGRVMVFRGLLEILEDENELAGVLAHEIAHVTQRHHLAGIARSIGLVALAQLVIGDYSGLIVIGVEVMRFLAENGYSRAQETEADMVAVTTLRAARLDPLALERALRRMQDKVGALPEAMKWVSTHPVDEERRAAIRAAADEHANPAVEKLPIDWAALRVAIGAPQTSEGSK